MKLGKEARERRKSYRRYYIEDLRVYKPTSVLFPTQQRASRFPVDGELELLQNTEELEELDHWFCGQYFLYFFSLRKKQAFL